MIINEVMEYIWGDVAQKYNEELNRYLLLTDTELADVLSEKLQTMERGINSCDYAENILPTCGCNNRHRDGKLSGCAMCDWESGNYAMCAAMAALKQKNRILYVEILRKSIEINRGSQVKPSLIEEFATHDLLDEGDIIPEFYDDIFINNKLYEKRPFFGIMAARPDSITPQKIKKWKSQYRKNLIVGMGVETSDEWLRNHWLNKNTSQKSLIDALKILEEENVSAGGDILFGIPGISAGHSINILKESLAFLNETTMQSIVVSPLSRKKLTLQNFVYNNLANKEEIIRIYGGETYFTDIPSPYTLLIGMHEALNEISGVEQKIKISPQNTMAYLNQIKHEERYGKFTDIEYAVLNLFDEMAQHSMLNVGIEGKKIEALYSKAKKEEAFGKQFELLETQRQYPLKKLLAVIMRNVITFIWGAEVVDKVEKFEKELAGYEK